MLKLLATLWGAQTFPDNVLCKQKHLKSEIHRNFLLPVEEVLSETDEE